LARPIAPELFDLGQLDVTYEAFIGTLWAYMTPDDRPMYSLELLRDWRRCFDAMEERFTSSPTELRYMVVGSRYPGVFNLGGDLENFARWVEGGDREALRQYGYRCIELLYRVWSCSDMPLINIALVQGDAFGGGLESMLAFDIVVAERQARFCLPEIKFGMFPGMGAFTLLSRRLGPIEAEKMVRSGRMFSAEEFHEIGIVTMLAEPGEGEQVVRNFIAESSRRHVGNVALHRASRLAAPISMVELRDIVDLWADTALQLTPMDLRMMRKLASAQDRLPRNAEPVDLAS
jgi:DSF synthase